MLMPSEDIVSPRFCVTINLHTTLVVMPNTKPLHGFVGLKKTVIQETNDQQTLLRVLEFLYLFLR
jgi:hypothetical protein